MADVPVNECPPDSFFHDPRDPSPTIGGVVIGFVPWFGPYDQRWSVESRDDVLVFSTGALEDALVLDGELKAILYVSSDCLDTDFSVRVCDVYPDGRSMLVMDAIRRMRFRESFSEELLMTPGEIYRVEIELPHTALTFLPGHQVRLCISSSNYPRFDVNLNNGDSLYVPGDTLIALNRIYHDIDHPSALILPIVHQTGVEDPCMEANALNLGLECFPNPFTGSTRISFAPLEGTAKAALGIYNIRGEKIRTLLIPALEAELAHHIVWDGEDDHHGTVCSGSYFYRLRCPQGIGTAMVILLR